MFPINFKRRALPDANGDCSAIDRIGTTLQRRLAAIRKRALDVDSGDSDAKRRRTSVASSDDGQVSTHDAIDEFFEQKHRQRNSDDDNTSSEDDDDGSLSDDGTLALDPLPVIPYPAYSHLSAPWLHIITNWHHHPFLH
jgi:hypothetical protein